MSEVTHGHAHDEWAKIINLDEYRSEPNDPRAEALAEFLSQATHPSHPSGSKTLAEYVVTMIGDKSTEDLEGLDERQLEMRGAITSIMVDESAIDFEDEQLAQDEPFAAIESALRATREASRSAELQDQRLALRALWGLRATVVHHPEFINESDEKRWEKLIQKLGHTGLES